MEMRFRRYEARGPVEGRLARARYEVVRVGCDDMAMGMRQTASSSKQAGKQASKQASRQAGKSKGWLCSDARAEREKKVDGCGC